MSEQLNGQAPELAVAENNPERVFKVGVGSLAEFVVWAANADEALERTASWADSQPNLQINIDHQLPFGSQVSSVTEAEQQNYDSIGNYQSVILKSFRDGSEQVELAVHTNDPEYNNYVPGQQKLFSVFGDGSIKYPPFSIDLVERLNKSKINGELNGQHNGSSNGNSTTNGHKTLSENGLVNIYKTTRL